MDTKHQEVLLALDVSTEQTITDCVAPADIRMLSIRKAALEKCTVAPSKHVVALSWCIRSIHLAVQARFLLRKSMNCNAVVEMSISVNRP